MPRRLAGWSWPRISTTFPRPARSPAIRASSSTRSAATSRPSAPTACSTARRVRKARTPTASPPRSRPQSSITRSNTPATGYPRRAGTAPQGDPGFLRRQCRPFSITIPRTTIPAARIRAAARRTHASRGLGRRLAARQIVKVGQEGNRRAFPSRRNLTSFTAQRLSGDYRSCRAYLQSRSSNLPLIMPTIVQTFPFAFRHCCPVRQLCHVEHEGTPCAIDVTDATGASNAAIASTKKILRT